MTRPARDVTALAALLAGMGVAHFAKPKPFERIVPRALPAKRALVHASGVAEVACAAGLLHPRTRRAAGYATTALLVAVFPANVQMAADVSRSRRASTAFKVGTIARLPLQLPLIRISWKATRDLR
ncbi:DoxX family protein [Mumia sp. DW29H23]|uniref:DoxX family protein n=1 Tax=Mumia sp. DW29H23 TaxID=3421241 RepID=UPI003D698AA3